MRAFFAGLLLTAIGLPTQADTTLESLRRTDLNDYAFGVVLAVNQDPYAGGETSTYLYPYLTSLTHPALTKKWLFLQDGDIGLRYVSDSGWDAGYVVRPQTLGLGPDNEEAEGLVERRWSVDAAGLGFNYYTTRLEGLSSGTNTVYESTHSGPLLYMGLRF